MTTGLGAGRRAREVWRTERALWWTAFAVVLGLSAVWSFASPLSSAPDEPAHVVYATGVVRGDLTGTLVPDDSAIAPDELYAYDVPEWSSQTLGLFGCYAQKSAITAECAPDLAGSERSVQARTWMGHYPPTYYVLVGWPTWFTSGSLAFHLMRLVSAALCAALAASAVASAAALRRSRVAVAGVALALTPSAVFLFGSVNSSGPEIAAGIALWPTLVLLLEHRGRVSRRLATRFAVVAAALALTRPLGPLWVCAIGALVLVTCATPTRVRDLLRQRVVQVALAAVAVAGLAAAGWILTMHPERSLVGEGVDVGLWESIRHSWSDIEWRTRLAVGVFGWVDVQLPPWAHRSWLGLTAVVYGAALAVGRWRQRLALVLVLAVGVVLPLLIEAMNVRDVGYIWSGRYALPLLAGIPVLSAWVLVDRFEARRWPMAPLAVAGTVVAVGVGTIQLVAHAIALSRYVGGMPAPVFDYVTSQGWRPPLGRKGQLVSSVAFTGAWAALVASCAWLRNPAPPPDPVAAEDVDVGGARGTAVGAEPGGATA